MTGDQASRRTGLICGLGAYVAWGVLPLYFRLLAAAPPIEIVAHRVIWSLLFLAGLITIAGRWARLRAALTARVLGILVVTATLIAANWLIFIWAILGGHVLEASLGYYLNPLFNVLLGVVLLKERLSRAQGAAVLLAAAGVAALASGAAAGLGISLSLALTFGLYGFVRKVAPVEALEGLTLETAILVPVAAGYIMWVRGGLAGFAAFDAVTDVLLALAGIVTAVPLLLFNAAAKRLPYSTLGFLQYIAPSLQFLLAVAAFGEQVTAAHAICFAAIWAALAIFAIDGIRRVPARRA